MTDRHDLVKPWYEEVLASFTRAGMPRYAIETLGRIQAIVATRRIDASLLAIVRSEVREEFERAA
jgi:hypothetical protein